MHPLVLVAAVVLLAEAVACLIAAGYVVSKYLQIEGGDKYLRRLVVRNVRVAAGAGLIALVIGYSLARFALPDLSLEPLVPPLGALLIALPLAWMMWGPIADALQWWKESRQ